MFLLPQGSVSTWRTSPGPRFAKTRRRCWYQGPDAGKYRIECLLYAPCTAARAQLCKVHTANTLSYICLHPGLDTSTSGVSSRTSARVKCAKLIQSPEAARTCVVPLSYAGYALRVCKRARGRLLRA